MNKTVNILMVLFAFVFPLSLGAANTLLALITLAWIVEGHWKEKWRKLRSQPIVSALFGIGLLTLLSAALSPDEASNYLASEDKNIYRIIASHYLFVPLIAAIFYTSIRPHNKAMVFTAFLSAIVISEIASYAIAFGWLDTTWLQAHRLIIATASPHNPSPFLHHLEYSILLCMAIILLLHRFFQVSRWQTKLFLALFILSATTNLFINGGRTGQIAFIFALFTYVATRTRFHLKYLLITSLVLTGIIAGAYRFSPVFYQRVQAAWDNIQAFQQGDYGTSWSLRAGIDIATLDYLTSSPNRFLFGAGAKASKSEILTHAKHHFASNLSEPIRHLPHIHNQYLQFWVDGSLMALILFIAALWMLMRLHIPHQEKPLLHAFVVLFAFACLTDIPIFRYQPAMLFYLMVGYFLHLTAYNRKDRQ